MQDGNANSGKKERTRIKLPLISFFLGLASLVSLLAAVAIAIGLEAVGAVSLFRGFVAPLSIAGIIASLVAKSRIDDNDQKSRRQVKLGLLFSIVTLALIFLTALALLAFSLPKLLFAFFPQTLSI